ncbi:hypothetical protein EW026_g2678 [Hermanssonia centrifuga]|uniref:Uncharacterized protein n=2 Tax=Hermanssonia centrifuga TaxID=98765 RepID=A0A4S4KNJ1_9APHY|nr:hypothetical protein PHLCEN_2v253 [Hermanssonia centrifuga]THG99736.1 hypothetical protein EW026_g2678 [Hermanssonia centrifuga]
MHFSTFLAAALPIGAAMAATVPITVGENGTLTFTPSSVTAVSGDVLAFTFVSKNHTVTQSTFADPCTELTPTAIDSGFQFVSDPTQPLTFNHTLTDADVAAPLWFYCRQTGHCQMGMVLAVNPTAQKTFGAFQQAAMASGSSVASVAPGSTLSGPSSSASAGTSPTDQSSAAAQSGSPTASSNAPDSSNTAPPSGSAPPSTTTSNAAGVLSAGSAGSLLTGIALLFGLVI